MTRKLKKIKQNEYYLINIVLLYCIFLTLLVIGLVIGIVYFAKGNFIITIAGLFFALFFALNRLKRLEKLIYEESKE